LEGLKLIFQLLLFLYKFAGMNIKPSFWFLMLIFIAGSVASAIANHSANDSTSNNSNSDSLAERIYTVGLDYGSNQSFKGRNTGQRQPYYSPNFNYQAKSGFFTFVSITNNITSKSDTTMQAREAKKNSIDEWQINPGYNFDIEKNTTASISFTHYFVNDTALINAGIKNNIDYYMDHDFKIVNEKLSLDLDWGTQTDFSIALETYHSFDLENLFTEDNDMLSFIPGFTITAGTQNFYVTKEAARRRLRAVTTSTTTFNIIAFDLILPLAYNIGDFTIEPAFNYSAALNQPVGLQTKPFGYVTVALTYDF
jgi:hypothetical protein